MSCYQYLLSATYSYVTTLRTNGKFIAHLFGTEAGITSHLLWGYCAVSVKTAGVATPVAVAETVMVLGDGGRV